MKEKYSRLVRILFAAVLLAGGILPAASTPAHAQMSPDFGIGMATYFVYGWDWPLDDPVTLRVNDPATPESPVYVDVQYPYLEQDDWLTDFTGVRFDLPIQLKLGFSVEMSNSNTTVTHTVEFEVTNVSLLFDQVSGKAVPGDEITVFVQDYANSTDALRRVIVDLNGLWVADFTQPGDGADEQELMDLASYNQSVDVGSESGFSHTYYASSLPVPFLNTFLDREASAWDIRSAMWPANTAVTIEIDDPETPQSPDYKETRNTKLHPRYPYVYRVDFFLNNFVLTPDMVVRISDGYTAIKEQTVLNFQVTDIDVDADTVCGYAAPESQAQVEIDGEIDAVMRIVETDSDGSWCADFSAPDPMGDEVDTIDIVPGGTGLILQSDEDGDNTIMEFVAPSMTDIDEDGIPDLDDACPADVTNTCNSQGSTAEAVGLEGETLVTEDQTITMSVPADALGQEKTFSITEAGSGYLLTDDGQSEMVFSADIEPSGTTFREEVTMNFRWLDGDGDGVVDGTNLFESALVIIKDGVVITDACEVDPGCDMVNNIFTFQVQSLSTFALSAFLAPSIESFTATPVPVQAGANVVVSAFIQDAEQSNTYDVIWDWGDGVTTIGISDGPVVQATHAYDQPGVYSLTLEVDEGEDGSDMATFEYVVVYDPEGGFVTGGGWINSPAGACRFGACSEDTTGMANFGFVSKYKKGAAIPTGNTEFNFKAGGLNFKSTSYQWLVVAGSKAIYKGFGTINGIGNFGFLLSAVDSALSRSTSMDLVRIKIWDTQTGDVVYDNQMGASEDADPTTAIGGGSIVIHK